MDASRRQRQRDLVEQVYEAAMTPPHWRGLCASIAPAFGADSAVLAVLDEYGPARVLDRSANFTDALQLQYEQHYCHEDVWARRARELGAGRAYSSAELVADGDLLRSCYYADFCRPAGIFYVVGALLPLGPREQAVIGIHRARGAGHYDRDDQRQLAAFLPHLQRALRLARRLEQAGLALRCGEAALASAHVAAFVVDAELRVLHATDSAAALLAPGSPLRLLHGRLSATVAPGGASLAQLVRAALPGAGAGAGAGAGTGARANAGARAGTVDGAGAGHPPCAQAVCLPRPGLAPLTLTVAPLPARPGAAPHALLLLRAPEQATVAAEALRQLYQLTPAEADVAKALAEGCSLEQCALARRISVNTLKTHLQRVYAKTGTCRQGELVALLHGSAAMFDAAAVTRMDDDDDGGPAYTVRTGRPHDRLATGPGDACSACAPTHCDRSPS